mgnify:FL=1|jgi:hypothetical protein|tara:strand:- start:734 stop:1270 length:537 start_codon:yes stop_codon:yes gene_type:complete
MKKNSHAYCEGSYLSLKANLHKWGDPDWTRFLTRIFYNSMFGAGTNPTGFISESALHNKLNKKKTCQDHYLSPQFIGRMILDNQEKYLCDLETYTKIFTIACSTVEVTVEENSILRQYTSNKDNEYRVFVSTDKKYDEAGIKLCKRPEGKTRWKHAQLTEEKLFFPDDLIQYEKRFLV